jgi:organic radical activating enzyme
MLKKKIIYELDASICDFPSRYSLVIYFNGCNLHCPYCYNKHVINGSPKYSLQDAIEYYNEISAPFVGKEKPGVVFTGGEPTINKHFQTVYQHFAGIPKAIHTNGLVLPKENQFNSVVLSIKGQKDGIDNINNYSLDLASALIFYSNCKQKEIRYVDVIENIKDYNTILNNINHYIEYYNYNLKKVENQNKDYNHA